VKPAFNGTWTARRGCRRRPTRRHFLLLSALLRVDSAGPTGCRSGTAVAVDDPSTRTATIARVAGERFSAFCPNFPWWWGSLFCSPRGGAESPMMVFEPLSHREDPSRAEFEVDGSSRAAGGFVWVGCSNLQNGVAIYGWNRGQDGVDHDPHLRLVRAAGGHLGALQQQARACRSIG